MFSAVSSKTTSQTHFGKCKCIHIYFRLTNFANSQSLARIKSESLPPSIEIRQGWHKHLTLGKFDRNFRVEIHLGIFTLGQGLINGLHVPIAQVIPSIVTDGTRCLKLAGHINVRILFLCRFSSRVNNSDMCKIEVCKTQFNGVTLQTKVALSFHSQYYLVA